MDFDLLSKPLETSRAVIPLRDSSPLVSTALSPTRDLSNQPLRDHFINPLVTTASFLTRLQNSIIAKYGKSITGK